MARVNAPTAPPQAPPPMRGRSSGPATLRGRRLALAAEAAVCCYHAALWSCGAASAALIAVRRACGEDSRAAFVARVSFLALFGAMSLVHLVSLLLSPWSRESLLNTDAREDGGPHGILDAATQRRRPESTGARGRQDVRRVSVLGCISFAAWMFVVLGLVMLILVPGKGTWMLRVGSMLADIGLFLYQVTFCFVKFPELRAELRATYAKLKCGITRTH